jgi:cholesterol oxidase
MSTPKIGISFREVMSGGFALGATDPADGEKRGRSEGSEMTLHGAIAIDDLDQFIAEADHPGTLTGTLDFTPFGDGLAAVPGGIFNLFSPTGDPKLKLMVYEMGFQHGGKSYYLAGQKDVRQDPIFDLWKATTTLYSKLHEGTDKSGPVVGAGILSLGVKQLIQLMSTLKAPGATSFTETSEAMAKFGTFFLGELWDTYVRHAKP